MSEDKISSLRELVSSSQVPSEEIKLEILTSDEIVSGYRDRICMGIFGNTGSGKTRMGITILQYAIIKSAENDDYISWFFSDIPEIAEWLLTQPVEVRRAYLLKFNRLYFIDSDKRGAEPLLRSINPTLKESFVYIPITTAKEAYAAGGHVSNEFDRLQDEGVEIGGKTYPFGYKGFWVFIDNVAKIWGSARTEYVADKLNINYTDFVSMLKQEVPGKKFDKDVMSKRASRINDEIDYDVVIPEYDDMFLGALKSKGFNLILASPPKERPTIVDVEGTVVDAKNMTLGGSKMTPHLVDYIIGLGKDEMKKRYFADIQKVRTFDAFRVNKKGKENKVSIIENEKTVKVWNPDFGSVLENIREMEEEFLNEKKEQYENEKIGEMILPGTPAEEPLELCDGIGTSIEPEPEDDLDDLLEGL